MYIVVADPGWGNPPMRNSAAVGVWRIDQFKPTEGVPAQLVAFNWVYGEGSADPWLAQFAKYVMDYRAVGRCYFDGTGQQAGYVSKIAELEAFQPQPVNFGGNNKFAYLNLLRVLMGKGLLAIPNIAHIYSQHANYKYPEGNTARNDLVSMMIVTAAALEPMYYAGIGQTIPTKAIPQGRNTRQIRSRHSRIHAR